MIDFSKELNPEQLAAVRHGTGPALVIAGAGSGKTRVITYRVARLLSEGVHPSHILLLTFTNKAAAQMNERIKELSGVTLPWSGTFHHVAYRMLKIHAPVLNMSAQFTVLDADDSQAILKLTSKEVWSDHTGKRMPSPAVLSNIISFARNAQRALSEVIEEKYSSWEHLTDDIGRIAERYRLRKAEGNLVDFDDLLEYAVRLLEDPQVRGRYARQFEYILVDEYQDTNLLQSRFLALVAAVHNTILVVGDDSQSIYSFRAATIENILRFPQNFLGAKVYTLTTNYRSTNEILQFANESIRNNPTPYEKELKSLNKKGVRPVIAPAPDAEGEGQLVANLIEKWIAGGIPPHHIAVLFRAAHHSQRLEVELTTRGLAYEYRGGVRFFERAHIKDALAYFRLLYNARDAAAWARVLLPEEGIGPSGVEKIVRAVAQANSPADISAIGAEILSNRAQAGWNNFVSVWQALFATERTPALLFEALLQSNFRDRLETQYIDSRERLADLKELASFAKKYETLEDFLGETTLLEGSARPGGAGERAPRLVLSTVHQAKGLEWSRVVIINAASGAFPSERALKERGGLEEERRLFYVAVTRAKDELVLTYPLSGGIWGDALMGPSPFIEEIDAELYEDRSPLGHTPFPDSKSDGIEYITEEPFLTTRVRKGSFLKEIEEL